jgi:NADH dehydrogenase (ubiquinone) 1 beta subcomplex subunit 8
MLSQRIVRASALQTSLSVARRLPVVQHRTFFPEVMKGRLDERLPTYPNLTDAEDPGQVGWTTNRLVDEDAERSKSLL